MSFRRRTYLEVLDTLLASLTGGIAGETHPFPPPGGRPFRHHLERPPARQVIAVYGSRDGESHAFRPDVDYKLVDDGRTLEWQPQGELPEPGTVVQVSYYPASARAALTDIHPGSVLRTIAESFALEVAALYAELGAVYDAACLAKTARLSARRRAGGRPPWRCSRPSARCGHSSAASGR